MISLPKIATEWQRFDELSSAALYEMLRFRQAIFVVEQRSPYPDLDGLDQGAWHLLLRAEGRWQAACGCRRRRVCGSAGSQSQPISAGMGLAAG